MTQKGSSLWALAYSYCSNYRMINFHQEERKISRISLQIVESRQGPVKEDAATLKESLGVVPNSLRTYAHRPKIAMAFAQLAYAGLGTDSVNSKLKTTVAYNVSTTNGCP